MNMLIKLLLAALFIGCLFKMPYNYYQIVRFISLFGFSYSTYTAYLEKKWFKMVILLIGLILFNPIDKVTFDKDTWHVIDVAFAIALLLWVINDVILLLRNRKKGVRKPI